MKTHWLITLVRGMREIVGSVFGETARKATSVHAKRKRASAVSAWPRPTASVHQWDRSRLALFGVSALVTLVIAVIALSLFNPQSPKVDNAATISAAMAQMTPSRTTNEVVGTANSIPTPVAVDISRRQMETAQALAATSVAAAETAVAGATATQQAINAAATRQALGFIECDTIDLEILQAPTNIEIVAASATNVELHWQVSNKATSPNCKWGQAGQETKLLRAMAVGSQPSSEVPVKLKWVQEDVYDLSLNVQLSVGRHAPSWRLILPKTGLPAGPDLEAKVSVLRPTPKPTATPLPSPTSCPLVTYECNCRDKPDSHGIHTRVCEQCIKEQCP
jgi:stage V sporulation protein SpoVS